jgi:trehalose synthase
VKEIGIQQLDPGRFDGVLEPEPARRFAHRLAEAADRLAGRRVWHVNSTEKGGGGAEMLHFLLGYLAGAGIEARWVVLEGTEDFFEVTNAELQQRVGPGDVVVLHDPQTVGLAPELKRLGATVVWSCHVGVDQPNDLARTAWEFLRPYVQAADAYVFSRPAYCWEGLDRERMAVIPPCIDAFAPKNQPMAPPTVSAILQATGILDARNGDLLAPVFRHLDGSPGRVVGGRR